jgi:hypothetical protein
VAASASPGQIALVTPIQRADAQLETPQARAAEAAIAASRRWIRAGFLPGSFNVQPGLAFTASSTSIGWTVGAGWTATSAPIKFTQGLGELGWTDGRNVRMVVRWPAADVDRMRMFAKELVDLQPDVILSWGTPATAALQRETRTVPSYSRRSPIRWALASLPACPARVEISPASSAMKRHWEESGCSCSRRSRPAPGSAA